MEAFSALLEAHPDSAMAGRGLQDARRQVLAPAAFEALYRAAVDADPLDATAWYLYGRALIDRPLEAEPAFSRSIELDPSLPWPVAGLAFIRYSRGDVFGAVTVYEEGVRRAPRSAQMRLLLGNQYLDLKLFVHALRHIEVARRLAPDDLEVTAAMGKVRLALGEEEAALELLEAVRAQEPRIGHVCPSLAEVYLRRGRAVEAEEVYRAGLLLGQQADDAMAAEIRTKLVVQRIREGSTGQRP